jgi:hypothetical protein
MKEDNNLLVDKALANWHDPEIGNKINDCDIIIDKINEIEVRCLERLESVETLLKTLKKEIDYKKTNEL